MKELEDLKREIEKFESENLANLLFYQSLSFEEIEDQREKILEKMPSQSGLARLGRKIFLQRMRQKNKGKNHE